MFLILQLSLSDLSASHRVFWLAVVALQNRLASEDSNPQTQVHLEIGSNLISVSKPLKTTKGKNTSISQTGLSQLVWENFHKKKYAAMKFGPGAIVIMASIRMGQTSDCFSISQTWLVHWIVFLQTFFNTLRSRRQPIRILHQVQVPLCLCS